MYFCVQQQSVYRKQKYTRSTSDCQYLKFSVWFSMELNSNGNDLYLSLSHVPNSEI